MSRARRAAPWLLLAATTFSLVAIAGPNEFGRKEYVANCAACHGVNGHGDGPMAGLGTQAVPDLSTLNARHGGSFPYGTVYATIEGSNYDRRPDSEMPDWSARYGAKAAEAYFDVPYDAEAYTRTRILAITRYLTEIQD